MGNVLDDAEKLRRTEVAAGVDRRVRQVEARYGRQRAHALLTEDLGVTSQKLYGWRKNIGRPVPDNISSRLDVLTARLLSADEESDTEMRHIAALLRNAIELIQQASVRLAAR